MLKKDHEEVKGILGQLKETKESASKKREELFQKLRAELEKMQKGEDQWGAKMTVFKELVEHHIKDEESKGFKSAEKALDHDEMQNIMKQFEQEKQKIRKNLK